MKMKITILEDSVIESERLKNGIRKYGQQYDWDIEIDEYESGEEYFSKNSEGTTIQASAFFLDIQMGQMNGIEVAKRLRESGYQGIIVFLTAFREYVFRGYEVRALNYLLKPVKENTLFLCLDEIAKALSNNTYIYRNKQEIVSIPYADILTFSSRLHYVDILTVDGKCYEQMSTLNKIIVHLPSEFIRTHRSYIVNMAHIRCLHIGNLTEDVHKLRQIGKLIEPALETETTALNRKLQCRCYFSEVSRPRVEMMNSHLLKCRFLQIKLHNIHLTHRIAYRCSGSKYNAPAIIYL